MVFWNGSTDQTILNRLDINCRTLDMLAYASNQSQHFFLQLLLNTQILCEIALGYVQKTGQMLNLTETHMIVCKRNHNIYTCARPCFRWSLIKMFIWQIVKENYLQKTHWVLLIYIIYIYMYFFRIFLTLPLLTFATTVTRYSDDKLLQPPGLYYENRGLVNIITSHWDLTTFINLSNYDQRWNGIDNYWSRTNLSCNELQSGSRKVNVPCRWMVSKCCWIQGFSVLYYLPTAGHLMIHDSFWRNHIQ
jgi:hypothetical protein